METKIFADQTVTPSTHPQDSLALLSSYHVEFLVIYIVVDCKVSLVMILQEYEIGYKTITQHCINKKFLNFSKR